MLCPTTQTRHDKTIHANAIKSWHCIMHYNIDPQKIRPFLKTLPNTTQHARLIIIHPLQKHIKAQFPLLTSWRLNKKVSIDQLYSNATNAAYGLNVLIFSLVWRQQPSTYMYINLVVMDVSIAVAIFHKTMEYQVHFDEIMQLKWKVKESLPFVENTLLKLNFLKLIISNRM